MTTTIQIIGSPGSGKTSLINFIYDHCYDTKREDLINTKFVMIDTDDIQRPPLGASKMTKAAWLKEANAAIEKRLALVSADVKLIFLVGIIYLPRGTATGQDQPSGFYDLSGVASIKKIERWFYDLPLPDYVSRYYRREICLFLEPGYQSFLPKQEIWSSSWLIESYNLDRKQCLDDPIKYTMLTEDQIKTELIKRVESC